MEFTFKDPAHVEETSPELQEDQEQLQVVKNTLWKPLETEVKKDNEIANPKLADIIDDLSQYFTNSANKQTIFSYVEVVAKYQILEELNENEKTEVFGILGQKNIAYLYNENIYKLDAGTVIGKLVRKYEGYGFLQPLNGKGGNTDGIRMSDNDFYKNNLRHDDIVYATLDNNDDERRNQDIKTIKLISSAKLSKVGYIIKSQKNRLYFSFTDGQHNARIPIDYEEVAKLNAENSLIVAEIIRNKSAPDTVKISKEFESQGEIQDALLKIILEHNLELEFSTQSVEQAQAYGEEIPQDSINSRKDLRNLPLVTIDGEDARDFDDAVYATKLSNGNYRIVVAIADVSFYVRNGNDIDHDARIRTTSVYFPNKVIPMLPEELSNGLCSLNPNVERLALTADMEINANGELLTYEFYESVIKSHARLTYTVAQAIHDSNYTDDCGFTVVEQVRDLYQAYELLLKSSRKRSEVSFDTEEAKIAFDADGEVDNIVSFKRNDAHKVIEKLMILANVSAALFISDHEKNAPYRNHAKPSEEKIKRLQSYLLGLGVNLENPHNITPQIYIQLIDKLKDRVDASNIYIMLVKSMSQAVYDVDNIGHFSLSLSHYTHFTSPIRRYPDLLVHRVIKQILYEKKLAPKEIVSHGPQNYHKAQMSALCQKCSENERNADSASFAFVQWLKCRFMERFIGDVFEGYISAISKTAIFVTIPEYAVDGKINARDISQGYSHYDENANNFVSNGITYKTGDIVQVICSNVSLELRQISFVMKNAANTKGGYTSSTKPKKSSTYKKKKKKEKENSKKQK